MDLLPGRVAIGQPEGELLNQLGEEEDDRFDLRCSFLRIKRNLGYRCQRRIVLPGKLRPSLHLGGLRDQLLQGCIVLFLKGF
ncbi:hypothetical protein, conserved [Angomonas deanei]|uniref:Uncharacterized protein n=1 Tax=Angomonas deanei TaxID=59799 RepID=A0A7G2CRX0_9TRYP|nr:hypothetical protein, conserved [Angomonas deanei]